MKIKINTSVFVSAIKNLEKLSANEVLPVLNSIKLTVSGGQAVLTKTNVEKSVIAFLPADIESFGTVIIPAKTIELIRNLKDYEFEITEDKIITEKKTISYKSLEVEKYPEINVQTDEFFFEISELELHRMLEVKYCISSDYVRPILCGVCFDNNRTIAIDGYRMSIRQGNYESNINKLVIDKDTIELLNKIIDKKSNNKIKVYGMSLNNKDNQFVKFIFDKIDYTLEVIGRTISGEYMNYQQIVPQDVETTITVNSKLVMDEVEFMYKAANKEQSDIIKITTGNNSIIFDGRITESIYDEKASKEATLRSQKEADKEYYEKVNKVNNPSNKGRKITKAPKMKTVKPVKIFRQEEVNRISAEVDAEISGNAWEAGFNMKYVNDALKMFDNTELKLKAVSSIAPLTITADDENIELILPIRFKN